MASSTSSEILISGMVRKPQHITVRVVVFNAVVVSLRSCCLVIVNVEFLARGFEEPFGLLVDERAAPAA